MSTFLGNITFSPHRLIISDGHTTTLPLLPKCHYCGTWPHDGLCPRIRAIEYHPDGTVKRVELKDGWED